MCVNFTNLNKACSRDSFLLQKIDQLVDFMTGFEHLSFLNANSGYHQILMYSDDEEKTCINEWWIRFL
jgi:hypothetical protein